MGIAHDGETIKGDEEFNKATTQCPISNKGYVGFQGTMSFKRFEKLS